MRYPQPLCGGEESGGTDSCDGGVRWAHDAWRATPGERRLAERLEQKLEDDYMLWYDVSIGTKQTHCYFVVIDPGRGVLIFEKKD